MQLLAGLVQEATKLNCHPVIQLSRFPASDGENLPSFWIGLCSLGNLSDAKDGHSPNAIPTCWQEQLQLQRHLLPFSSWTSVHEQPLGSRVRWRATHGALTDLLASMAVAANHMATRHQRHGRTVLVANGAVDASASAHRLLHAAGCHFFCLPIGCQTKGRRTRSHVLRVVSSWTFDSVWKTQLGHALLELLHHQISTSWPLVKVVDANNQVARPGPLLGALMAVPHELLHLGRHELVRQPFRFSVVGQVILCGLPGQLLKEHGKNESGLIQWRWVATTDLVKTSCRHCRSDF